MSATTSTPLVSMATPTSFLPEPQLSICAVYQSKDGKSKEYRCSIVSWIDTNGKQYLAKTPKINYVTKNVPNPVGQQIYLITYIHDEKNQDASIVTIPNDTGKSTRFLLGKSIGQITAVDEYMMTIHLNDYPIVV